MSHISLRHIAPLALVLAVAGCSGVVAPDTTTPQCTADAHQYLIGEGETSIAAVTWTPLRVIHAGDIVTADLNMWRLNVRLNGDGKIDRVYCG